MSFSFCEQMTNIEPAWAILIFWKNKDVFFFF